MFPSKETCPVFFESHRCCRKACLVAIESLRFCRKCSPSTFATFLCFCQGPGGEGSSCFAVLGFCPQVSALIGLRKLAGAVGEQPLHPWPAWWPRLCLCHPRPCLVGLVFHSTVPVLRDLTVRSTVPEAGNCEGQEQESRRSCYQHGARTGQSGDNLAHSRRRYPSARMDTLTA